MAVYEILHEDETLECVGFIDETMHDEVLSNYCPNCGAKMDGKGEGE